jgi:hypothetical protein
MTATLLDLLAGCLDGGPMEARLADDHGRPARLALRPIASPDYPYQVVVETGAEDDGTVRRTVYADLPAAVTAVGEAADRLLRAGYRVRAVFAARARLAS